MDSHSVFQALQLAVSPVILISAYGLLLLSMTNRLGRAIDRARLLVREGAAKEDQITIITRRAGWIRSAIVFTSLALLAAALLVVVLFASIYLPLNIANVEAIGPFTIGCDGTVADIAREFAAFFKPVTQDPDFADGPHGQFVLGN